MEGGRGWGLEGVAALAAGRSGDVALQMWIRASLNERALGARLAALAACPPLLRAWYTRCSSVLNVAMAGMAEMPSPKARMHAPSR